MEILQMIISLKADHACQKGCKISGITCFFEELSCQNEWGWNIKHVDQPLVVHSVQVFEIPIRMTFLTLCILIEVFQHSVSIFEEIFLIIFNFSYMDGSEKWSKDKEEVVLSLLEVHYKLSSFKYLGRFILS